MKKFLLLSLGLVFTFAVSLAQERTVSGNITSSEDGLPLPGVNVVLKGTTNGTITDVDGNYKLTLTEEGGTLIYSFVGLLTQEIDIGARSVIDIQLASDVSELSEVVVTAFGVVKEKKALGYGVTTISREAIANKQESDIARLLRGKATGVAINQTSGLAGSGTNIIIRGYSSITGSNQPLFIVDGIPFNTDTNSSQTFGSGSATASSRFLDLDPNTIEDISILKGLSATVLYGEAGRNGVILVTTKNGKAGAGASKKMEISFTQGLYQTEVANIPDYQNTFGNGFSAGFGWFFSNWGAAFADLNASSYGSDFQGLTPDGTQVLITHPLDQSQYNDDVPEFIGAAYPYEPHASVENFFQSGFSSNSSLSVQSALGDNASVSATYSFLREEGFTPKLDALRGGGRSNFLDKHNFGIGLQGKLENGLKLKTSFNFVNSDRLTPITAPAFGGDGNGLFAAILFTPRSMDLMGLPYQSPIDGSNIYYRRGSPIQNPRWTLNNSGQTETVQRFFSSSELSYGVTDNITVLYRLSLDNYSQVNRRFINKGGARAPNGELATTVIQNRITDQILNVLYDYNLSSSFDIDGIVGINSRREFGRGSFLGSTNQFIYNFLEHQNFINHTSGSGSREENTIGIYATATLSYNYYLFLNFQARNDWTSTLESANRSVLYPSVSLSFIPTDAFLNFSSNILNYLKFRVGFGTSAGYPDPYSTRSVLNSETANFITAGGTTLNTNSVSNFLGNQGLERELFIEIEGGVEARFWNNRIGLDLSLYNKSSEDLIINLPLDPATGFLSTTVNAAEVTNKGIELGIDISPPMPGEFQLDITWNFTKNVSEVTKIFPGIDRVQVSDPVSGGNFGIGGNVAGFSTLGNYAIPGEPFNALYGEDFRKVNDPNSEFNGMFIVDGQGNYVASGSLNKIGDPNPDYTMNWINNLSWKGISFGFHWQLIQGGDIFSSTVQAMLARGNTSDTDVDRDLGLIMPNAVKQTGVDAGGSPVYVPNDIQTYIGDSFFRGYFFADEGGVFDATVIRLRQVSLGYVLPKSILENTPFGTVGITISGENLFYNAPNFPEGINFDPEISSLSVGNGKGFDFRTAPTAKKFGVNLSVTF